MIHPLLIVGLETSSSPTGLNNTLVLSSPLGTTYRVGLDHVSAENFRLVIANEHKLVAVMHMNPPHGEPGHTCDEDDDDVPPPRQPGNRISRN